MIELFYIELLFTESSQS